MIEHLFAFDTSPLELVLRGTLMYWFLFLVFRFVLRRDAGQIGIADMLFVVIVADASQNALSGSYSTVAEGCVLVATLVGWNFAMDWASFRFPALRKLVEPSPVLLVKDGRLLARNLRQEFLTPEDLEAQMRQHDITSIAEVKRAYIESDGQFSFLTRSGGSKPAPPGRKRAGAA
ncbi:MAG: DUF421 domain-containing protein [Rubrivivax sp.]|nr:DUF421 domain-containing protein [Rubrivivax sp.]